MYDFVFGLAFGFLITRVLSKKKRKDESTQVDFVAVPIFPPTVAPIPIPSHIRSFVPGVLANFWGKDS
jgi:hypothetical protein